MDFQTLLLRLQRFWAEKGCVLQQPHDVEMGAGTMAPDTFLRVLGPEPWNVAYVQPCRRPGDGRYGDNPFRLGKYFQLQVILKPSPHDVMALYEESLRAIGIPLDQHDLRYEEDNWESPTLGAWGVGWQVLLDGLEITQFTYFQQAGGLDLSPISAEITYGLERLLMFITGIRNIFDLPWAPGVTYGDVRHREEVELSRYAFEHADVERHRRAFDEWEDEARRLIDAALPLPALDMTLKCSHLFNVLDARRALSVTERAVHVKRVRDLALGVAKCWAALREDLGHPLLKGGEALALGEAPSSRDASS